MSSNAATDNVSAGDAPDQGLQEFDYDIYKDIMTSFPRSITNLITLANTYHATLSPHGHKDLAAQALRDLLFRSRNELDMAKQLDRVSNAIDLKFKMADWIPDDGPAPDSEDATLKSREDLVRRNGSMGLQGSWLIANILGPIRRLQARHREMKMDLKHQQKWSHKLWARLANVHVSYNVAVKQLIDQENTLREELHNTQVNLDTATNSLVAAGNWLPEDDATIRELKHVIKTQQQQAVSGSEYKWILQRRAFARAWRPRVIRHSLNLNQVAVTTLPADGCMVRIGLELDIGTGPPDGPGFVEELEGAEDESLEVVEPTSNYATVSDESREAWLDWFDEAE